MWISEIIGPLWDSHNSIVNLVHEKVVRLRLPLLPFHQPDHVRSENSFIHRVRKINRGAWEKHALEGAMGLDSERTWSGFRLGQHSSRKLPWLQLTQPYRAVPQARFVLRHGWTWTSCWHGQCCMARIRFLRFGESCHFGITCCMNVPEVCELKLVLVSQKSVLLNHLFEEKYSYLGWGDY